jgi:hypothetical protein
MKKLSLLLFLLPFCAQGTVYTSVANGNWNTPTTWSPNGVPGSSDDVIINNTVSVTTTSPTTFANNITINSGGILTNSSGCTISVLTTVTNNVGGKWTGAGNIGFGGPVNGIFLTGGGDFSGQTGLWYFQGYSTATLSTVMIGASANIVRNNDIVIYTTKYSKPIRILNFGSVTFTSAYQLRSNGGKSDSWTQEANSTLVLANNPLQNSYDTLVASATGNLVEYSGSTSYTFKIPTSSNYYNLTLNGGTKTIPTTLTVNNFTLNSSTTANFNSLGMNVAGNWSNAGTLSNFTGTINFNGTSAQAIGGSKSTRFANITISGSGNVTLNTSSAFTGVMTLSGNGSLAASGANVDTLISTSAKTARVAQITGSGTITAKFVIQRYDGRTTANYALLSSPVVSTTLGDWNTSNRSPAFYMSGVGGPDGNAGSYVSVYIYGETTNTYNAVTTITSPGINYTLPQGQGIYLWMGNSLTTASAYSYITHGVPSTGTINKAVTFTVGEGAGFNMVGNPYPSPISWASVAGSNASLQNAFYLFEQDGSWHTFIGGSFIPMEQGFGVVTSSSTSISFKESYKSSTDAALQRPEKGNGDPMLEDNSVTFTLSNDANNFSCPTTISFGSGYSANYLSSEDAIFIKSFIKEVPQLYTNSGDSRTLTLNRLPDASSEIDVPITTVGNVPGNYILSTENIGFNLHSFDCVTLVDNTSGEVVNNFEDNSSYSFKVTEAGQTNHFTLKFVKLQPGETCTPLAVSPVSNGRDNIRIYSSSGGAVVNFRLAQPENAVVSVYSLSGQKVAEDVHTNAYNNEITIPLPGHNIYILRVETHNGITIKKIVF